MNKLSEKQKVESYINIISENELYFGLSLKNSLKLRLLKKIDEFLQSNYNKSFFEQDINKKREAIKSTGDPLQKKFLNCMIKMDKENIIWIKILNKIKPLKYLQEKKYFELNENKKLRIAKDLFKIQRKIFTLKKELNKHIIEKANAQEELKKISEDIIKNNKSLNQIFILGFLADLFSISNNFGGTKASLSYTLIKKSIPQIRNNLLRTRKMKKHSEEDLIKLNKLEKELDNCLK